MGPKAFLELPVVLGFSLATGPTLKTALCHILTLAGRRINTAQLLSSCPALSPCRTRASGFVSFFFFLSFYFFLSFLVLPPQKKTSPSIHPQRSQNIPKLQTPILGHGAKYTNYGISLPQPCPPPSNLSATAWEKQMKSSFQESDHALPCPTLWFFKSKADGHVWKEEGLLAAEDWTPKGTYIAEQKK